MIAAFKTVYRVSGPSGYFKGIKARIIYQMPSTAICWSVYELFKYLLSRQVMESRCSDKSFTPKISLSDDEGPANFRQFEEKEKSAQEMRSPWGDSLEDGSENKARSLIDGIGTTYTDKSKWGNAVFTGTKVLGTLKMNTTMHEECDPRSDLFSDLRS